MHKRTNSCVEKVDMMYWLVCPIKLESVTEFHGLKLWLKAPQLSWWQRGQQAVSSAGRSGIHVDFYL
jgi:hypothetical protein